MLCGSFDCAREHGEDGRATHGKNTPEHSGQLKLDEVDDAMFDDRRIAIGFCSLVSVGHTHYIYSSRVNVRAVDVLM